MFKGGDILNTLFSGKWITAQEFFNNKSSICNFYMKVKKSFFLNKISKAYIVITADDYYKLYINGKYVGQGPAPGYDFAYNYNKYDITEFLQIGENIIDVIVYYQGLINRVFVSGDNKQGLIADIYFDNEFAFGTDESWVYCVDNSFISKRTVGYDTAFLEDRDLRNKDSEYKNCFPVDTYYRFNKKPFPALEVYPVSVKPVKIGNKYFYDFKQEYVCNLKINAFANNTGDKIIIHCAEELDKKRNLRYEMRCNCNYEEICILNAGENIIEQFDYKAFRYLEIIADGGVIVNDVKLLVRHYPFPEKAAAIKSKDINLQAVFNLCKSTVKYGTQEVFVDCPTREKGQYIGDVFIVGFAHFYLTKDCKMLKKAIENISQSVKYSGEILAVSPCSLKQKIADYSLLFPRMLWKYYILIKDMDFLKKMLPTCEFINNYFAKFEDKDGLLNKLDEQWNLVDWPDNLRDGYDFNLSDPIETGKHNVINAFYISSIECTEKIKKELNLSYKSKSPALKEKYNNVFFNEKTKLYSDSEKSEHSSIHSNMLPVVFDICYDEYKENVVDYLITRGMNCGVYMSYFYLKALCKAGRQNDAYKFIISNNENSWLNMINEGATTCFETWGKDKKWNTSLFHPWAVAPVLILFEHFPDEISE